MFNVHIHTILNSLLILKLFEKDCGILNPSWDWFQNTSLHSQILERLMNQLATGSQILHLIVEPYFLQISIGVFFQTVEVIPNRPQSVTGYLFD